MAIKIKIHLGINLFPRRGIYVLLLGTAFILFARPSFAQNNILYVSPRIESAISGKISKNIENTITSKITDVKVWVSYIAYTASKEDQTNLYNKIRGSSADFILKLEKITDASSYYELNFSLSQLNKDDPGAGKLFEEERVPWENAAFIIRKNADIQKEIDEILADLKVDIDYYFKNENFRSRIFISKQKFEPAEEDFYTEFINWLENEMDTNNHSHQSQYIIFYDNKPYPQETSYILYGKFSDPVNNISSVEFKIEKDDNSYKVKPVNIYVEDFEYGNYEHEAEYRQKVINNIYERLSKIR